MLVTFTGRYLGTFAGLPSAIAAALQVLHGACKNPLQAITEWLFHLHLSFSSSFNPVLSLCAISLLLLQAIGTFYANKEANVMSMIKDLAERLQMH